VIRGAARRLLTIAAVCIGGTAALSVVLGALAGKNLTRSIAVGFYVVGALALVGCFIVGSGGPLRRQPAREEDLTAGPLHRRTMRKATPEERRESRRNALGLFALGLALVFIGAAIDPTRQA
jgi:hypothetical protein